MKRGTPEHFKTMRLARLLGTAERPADRAEAMGVLEMLCNHFAPRSAPRGDIGRCTNQEIADGCYTTRDPDALVRALLESGWLEEHAEHRLIIHDYHQHADEALRKYLHRHKISFATGRRRLSGKFRTLSGQGLDSVDPPRAGTGTGTGSEVLNGRKLPETVVRARGGRPWRRLPPGEKLTAVRRGWAAHEAGGELEVGWIEREWAKLADHEFKTAHVDVDATWRNWVREALTRRARNGPRRMPEPHYPDLSAEIAADRARDRAQRERAKASA